LLGGGKWVPSVGIADEDDRAVFLGDAWNDPSEIRFTLTLTTTALLPNVYPADRERLADRVIELRDEQHLHFKDIALLLKRRRIVGARGARLESSNVFSLYKKRKAYIAKRSAPIKFSISNMVVYPAKPSPLKSAE